MRKTLIGTILLSLTSVALSGTASAKTYSNARFGYSIEIPAAFSVADPEPENGDGQAFHPVDKSADLIVSGGWITQDDFVAEIDQYKGFIAEDGWKLTYETKPNKSFSAYSGQKGDRILYVRVITSCSGKAHAGYRLEYPAADKAKYDGTIIKLNASLKAGKGSCN